MSVRFSQISKNSNHLSKKVCNLVFKTQSRFLKNLNFSKSTTQGTYFKSRFLSKESQFKFDIFIIIKK